MHVAEYLSGHPKGAAGGISVRLGSTYLCYAGSPGSRVRRTTFGFWLSFLLPGSVAFLSCSLASVFITWEQRQYFPVLLLEELPDMNVFWAGEGLTIPVLLRTSVLNAGTQRGAASAMLAGAARAGARGTTAACGCVYSSDMGGLSPRIPLLWIEVIPPPGDYFQGFSLKLPSGGLAWPSLLTQGKQWGLEDTVLFRGPCFGPHPL